MPAKFVRFRITPGRFALAAFVLVVVVACSSGDDSATVRSTTSLSTTATTSPGATTAPSTTSSTPTSVTTTDANTVEPAPCTGTTAASNTTAPLTSLDQIFADAAANRSRIVAELTEKISRGECGIDADNVLRGPSGFSIDLDRCPANWNNTAGITDSQIIIGQLGVPSPASDIEVGFGNYIDWVNKNDPIQVAGSNRELSLQPTTTEQITSDNSFAAYTAFDPRNSYNRLNSACVPQPYAASRHRSLGDPIGHPWTTGTWMSDSTEPILWGEWIRNNLAEHLPVKVAGLAANDYKSGLYEQSFSEWAQANPDVVSEYTSVRFSDEATSLTDEMTSVAEFAPDVLIAMASRSQCELAVKEVTANDLHGNLLAAFVSSPCKSTIGRIRPASANGWWTFSGDSKGSIKPQHIDEPFLQFLTTNLQAAGIAYDSLYHNSGYAIGYAYVESLRIAAALPGGLTRSNFILAVRSTSLDHPMYLDGISFAANGAADAYFVEGSDYSQFDVASGAWASKGVLDVNSKTPNCSWDGASRQCR